MERCKPPDKPRVVERKSACAADEVGGEPGSVRQGGREARYGGYVGGKEGGVRWLYAGPALVTLWRVLTALLWSWPAFASALYIPLL